LQPDGLVGKQVDICAGAGLLIGSKENSVKRLAQRFGCPVELSLELLAGKWKPVILARLKERPYRYSELRKLIPRLSTKMLTERLRDLEAQGLVERRGIAGKPHAIYRLTARAESLKPVLQALYDWGKEAAAELKVEIRPSPPGMDGSSDMPAHAPTGALK
jgi:DNA-binding HxlR family transcriptional regulator